MPDPTIIGTWELVRLELRDEDGLVEFPWGADAQGRIMFTADGFFSALVTRAGQPRFASDDWRMGTVAEWAQAGRGCIAYAGRYRIDGDPAHSLTVINTPELSLFPNMIGQIQLRHIRWDGDRLILRSNPAPIGGRNQTFHITWRRL